MPHAGADTTHDFITCLAPVMAWNCCSRVLLSLDRRFCEEMSGRELDNDRACERIDESLTDHLCESSSAFEMWRRSGRGTCA